MLKNYRLWLIIGVFIGLFLLSSHFADRYASSIGDYLKRQDVVILITIYFLLSMLDAAVAPISVIPLMPIVSLVWGSLITALITVFGWSIGSLSAFIITRKYGRPFVNKLFSQAQISEIQDYLPSRSSKLFWSIVLFRVTVPFDITSYALGIFTNIRKEVFYFAALAGAAPSALFFSFIGELRWPYNLLAIAGGLMIFVFAINSLKSNKRKTPLIY